MNTLYEQLLSVDFILSEKLVHTIKSKIIEVYQRFKEKLETSINGAKEKTRNLKLKTDNLFRRDLALFGASTNRTENSDIIFYALLMLKPTSAESERVSSVARKFSTNLRKRMSN